MGVERTVTGRTRFAELQANLRQINRTWSPRAFHSLIDLLVRLLPRALGAERCGIFIVEPETERIVSKAGTGLTEGQIVAPLADSIVGHVIATGKPAIENDLAERPGFHHEIADQTGFLTQGVVCVPVFRPTDDTVIGAIEVLNRQGGATFGATDRTLLESVADLLSQALENARVHHELVAVSRRLERELSARPARYDVGAPVAECPAMRELIERTRVVADLPMGVLILGENGTGKERIARLLHDESPRADGPFVAVNCAAIPEALVESEFFGYAKGAFTGADQARGGRLEEADKGTLFLDEVGDLPLSIQAKLLRALQEGEGQRLGDKAVRRYDFRLVSATNRDLKAMVAAGQFREDLYYRIFSVELTLPPLRERGQDVMRLAYDFLTSTCRRFGKQVPGFAPEVVALFERYAWPGNVRQLRNEVERLVAFTPAGEPARLEACSPDLRPASAGPEVVSPPTGNGSLSERVANLERELIREAIESCQGNREKAAKRLGISRQGLYRKLERLGIE